jgi:ribosomal protein S20
VTIKEMAKAIVEKKGVSKEDPYKEPLKEALKNFMEAVKSDDVDQACEFLKDAVTLSNRE